MAGQFDALARMFERVIGRPPQGAAVSTRAVAAAMAKSTAYVRSRLDMDDYDALRVPEVYLEFWRRFGAEERFVDQMTTLYPPDKLRATIGELVFGIHNTANALFGIGHQELDQEDPPAMFADADLVEREEGDDAEGDEIWEEFADTLSDGLIQIAAENLMRSFRRLAIIKGCNTAKFRALLARLESLYGADVSKVKAPMIVYYRKGVIVSHEPGDDSANVACDTAEREAAFRKQFPEAE